MILAIEAFDTDVVLAVNQTALVAAWVSRRLAGPETGSGSL